MLLTLLGVALGVSGSLVLTGALETLLFNLTPTDTLTFVGAAGVLTIVALAAGLVRARRASLMDPLGALKVE